MNFQASIKMVNKLINHDLKNLSNWLNANKIPLNFSKTELVPFIPPRKTTRSWTKKKAYLQKALSDWFSQMSGNSSR